MSEQEIDIPSCGELYLVSGCVVTTRARKKSFDEFFKSQSWRRLNRQVDMKLGHRFIDH